MQFHYIVPGPSTTLIFIKPNLKISNNLNQSVNTNVDIVIQLLMKCLIQWKLRTLVEVELNDRQRDP